MASRRIPKIPSLFLLAVSPLILVGGCLNSPLPPQDASLSATVLLDGSEDHEGIEVILPGTSYRGFTNREGRILFDHLPPRTYELIARFGGYVDYREQSIALEPGDHIDLGEIRLAALPQDGSISGVVALEGIESATVEVMLLGSSRTTQSSPDGKFEFEHVLPGQYRVDFRHSGFAADQPVPVTVEAGSTISLTKVILAPRPAEPDLTAAREAAVEVKMPEEPPPIPSQKNATPVPEPAPGVPVDPNTPGIVRGAAFYPDQQNHSGILIRLVDPPRQSTTDDGGSFLIADVPPGARTLRAEAEGYLSTELPGLNVLPGDVTTAPHMTLSVDPALNAPPAPARVYGQVVLRDKGPQAGTSVALAGTSLTALTGSDGTFLLSEVPWGAYTVIASRDDYEPYEIGVEVSQSGDIPVPVITLEPEAVYLQVVETIPAQDARKVEVSDRVHAEIRFNERLLPRTARPSITITPPVATRVGVPEADLISIELLRVESPKVEFGTRYLITVGTELESTEGHRLAEPYVLAFTTGGPRILDTFPASGQRDILLAADEPIVINFNKSVDLRDLAEKIKITPHTGEIPNIRQQRMPYGQRVEVQIQVEPNRRYRLGLPRSLRTQSDHLRYENTPYKIEFRTGDYDNLIDTTDEFLKEFDDFLDQ
jgi:hypothetical protein